MKTWYNSRRWRRDVLFPLVTFAVCSWKGRSRDTFSASGGSSIRPQVSPDKEGGPQAEIAAIRDSQWCFLGGVSVQPITHWCLSPSLTPPRGKQMRKGFSLPNCAVGFHSSSPRSVNPYVISWGNGRAINRHV